MSYTPTYPQRMEIAQTVLAGNFVGVTNVPPQTLRVVVAEEVRRASPGVSADERRLVEGAIIDVLVARGWPDPWKNLTEAVNG